MIKHLEGLIFLTKLEKDINNKSVFFFIDQAYKLDNNLNEVINKKIDINWKTSTVYSGKKKVYTIPILQCRQSNLACVNGNIDLNGTDINWWLKSDRIYNLCRGSDIPITKQEFNKLFQFKITRDKTITQLRLSKVMKTISKIPSRSIFQEEIEDVELIENRIFSRISKGFTDIDTYSRKPLITQEHDMINLGLDENIMKELENEMGDIDFGEVKFQQIDDNSDDESFAEYTRILEESEHSDENNSDKYLNFNEFQNMIPQIKEGEFLPSESLPYSIDRIESKGDPSRFIIDRNYIDKGLLKGISTKEKLGLLYRCKDIIYTMNAISDAELYFALTMCKDILEDLSSRHKWSLGDDYVMCLDKDNCYKIFLEVEGFESLNISEQKFVSKGGIIETIDFKKIFLIPLSEDRQLQFLDTVINSLSIKTFVNTKILEDCYYRLFNEPFIRAGFAKQLLNELLEQ